MNTIMKTLQKEPFLAQLTMFTDGRYIEKSETNTLNIEAWLPYIYNKSVDEDWELVKEDLLKRLKRLPVEGTERKRIVNVRIPDYCVNGIIAKKSTRVSYITVNVTVKLTEKVKCRKVPMETKSDLLRLMEDAWKYIEEITPLERSPRRKIK